MKINIKSIAIIIIAAVIGYTSCKKPQYPFGPLNTPSDLTLNAAIDGKNDANPAGGGTGKVTITTTASKAISYKIDFGDGNTQIVPSGTITYKYNNPGTFDYTITVNAIGTGGTTSTISKKISVFVAFDIPAEILQNLTNGSSQVWVTDRTTPGHVGVGPADGFTPSYYAAAPNERAECLYDDEITFTKNANNTVSMSINNKGQSFFIGAATAFYGKSGGDNCYDIDVSGTRNLTFMDATSASTSANSTRIQFVVPGNGLINFGTGGNTYEILSLTSTQIFLRNIGIDGLAWYQKLKVKP
jgi:hypothetical protein